MRIDTASPGALTLSTASRPATAFDLGPTQAEAATATAASSGSADRPAANPSATIDPQLGIIVMQYYDPASGTTITSPTAQQLRAYTRNGLPQADAAGTAAESA
jgi:hypothetical protein